MVNLFSQECSNCKIKVRNDLEFCPNCHQRLKIEENESKGAQPGNQENVMEEQRFKKEIPKEAKNPETQQSIEGKKDSENLVQIDKTNLTHYKINLAKSLDFQNKTSEAEKIFSELFDEDKNNSIAWAGFGEFLERHSQFKEAEDAYKLALNLNPDIYENWIRIVNIYKSQQRANDILQWMMDIQRLKPDFRIRFDDEMFSQAIRVYPSDPNHRINYARTLIEQNKLDEAEIQYKKAIELNRTLKEPYYELARLVLARNRISEGEQLLENAIQLDPNYAEAVLLYNQIKHV